MGIYDVPWILRCCLVRLSWFHLSLSLSLSQLWSCHFLSPNSILLLCNLYSVRVSNEIGKGNAKAAKFSIIVILCTSISIGVIFWALFLAFGNKISYWFTSDEEVAEAVSSLSTLLAFSVLLNSVQPVLTGECFVFWLAESNSIFYCFIILNF